MIKDHLNFRRMRREVEYYLECARDSVDYQHARKYCMAAYQTIEDFKFRSPQFFRGSNGLKSKIDKTVRELNVRAVTAHHEKRVSQR